MDSDDKEARRKRRVEERQAAEEQELIEQAEKALRLYTLDAEQLLDRASDETEFLIEKALPAGMITFLTGPPGQFKSWLAYDAMLAVLHERDWLDFKCNKRRGRVFAISLDNPAKEFGRMMRVLGLKPEDKRHFRSHVLGASDELPDGFPSALRLPDHHAEIMMVIDYFKPDLIMIDSFRQAHTMNEMSHQDMDRIIQCLRDMTARNAAVLVIHHPPKPSREPNAPEIHTLSGAGSLDAGADVTIFVNKGKILWKKTRGWTGKEGKPGKDEREQYRTFKLRDGRWPDKTKRVHIELVNDYQQLLTLLRDGAMKRDDVRKQIGLSRDDLSSLVNRAIDDGIVRETRGDRGSRELELTGKTEDDDDEREDENESGSRRRVSRRRTR